MKNQLYIFLSLLIIATTSCNTSTKNDDSYESIKEAFLNPPFEARPKVYWWCLNGNVDTLTAKEEIKAMNEIGISGFDFFEIGTQRQDTTQIPSGPSFMDDESLQLIKFAVEQADKYGMSVGLNLSSSWNAGGSWIKPEHAGKSLYYSENEIEGNSTELKVKLTFPEISFPRNLLIGGTGKSMIPFREDGKPEYYEEIAVLAIPSNTGDTEIDTLQIVDVTLFFNPETEVLTWKAPPGNWRICRYVCSNSGQQVVLPSPLSQGLTIDHFDAEAVEFHLNYFIDKLQSVLGDFRKTALKSFYLASYEARGFVWTPTLPEVFKNLNGYEIGKFLPIFFNPEMFDKETVEKVDRDFKKTLSELMINNLYKKSREICNSHGLKINSEAGGPGYPLYNGPAEPLKAQGAIDIPRGEFWINHSRFYEEGNDSIDILRVVKEAAAASHIYQKGIVEMEAFTSFMHWQEGPNDMKPFGDRAFCEGMDKVVFHGFSHNISGSGFPGYVYGAGTHFNTKRVWWSKAKPFVDYLSRISAVFQKTDFKADVVWYYGDKVPNSATPKNTHFSVGPGYDYEVINTEILLDSLTVKDGKIVLSNGAEFSLLALEDENNVNSKVLQKLDQLVAQGAVIVGQKPAKVDNITAEGENKKLIDDLWFDASGAGRAQIDPKGKINAGITPLEMLQIIDIKPDIDYPDKEEGLIDFIHFTRNDVDVYFISNPRNEWISRNINFRQQDKSPEMWDPVSGNILPLPIFNQTDNYIEIPITLPPYGSGLIVFQKSAVSPAFNMISEGNSNPAIEYTPEGIIFLQEGEYKLSGKDKSMTVRNNITSYTIDTAWDVSFVEGWGAPEKVSFPELISWTDSEIEGVKYYSGTATYKNSFHFNNLPDENQKIHLNLGEISKVGDVWLNGQHVGISWTEPHRFDITDIINQGDNSIVVEIANTWSNRLTGDALTGKNFTNTNINTTIIPAPTMETGDQTRYPWARVPLIKSGLLGPVTIETINLINIKIGEVSPK